MRQHVNLPISGPWPDLVTETVVRAVPLYAKRVREQLCARGGFSQQQSCVDQVVAACRLPAWYRALRHLNPSE